MKVGYDYMLYYFIKFTSLCKIVRSYSYTSILVQYINKRSGDNTLILKMHDFLTCTKYLCIPGCVIGIGAEGRAVIVGAGVGRWCMVAS